MSFRFRSEKRRIMPPILTILIIVIIIGTGELIRDIMNEEVELEHIPVSIMKVDMTEKEYIDNQQAIAAVLQYEADIKSDQDEEGNFPVFTGNLINYLRSKETDMEDSKFRQLKQELIDLKYIMNREHEHDFSRMSIDGRAVAINIASRIYDLAGLKLVTDFDGNIRQVIDPSDKKLYDNAQKENRYNFQLSILIITLFVITTLTLCVIIYVRKKKLFHKEEIYDEFDKKRYA